MITVYFLQMLAHPHQAMPPSTDGVQIMHSRRPTIAWYRFLYDAVGKDWNWTSRKKLSDAALAAIIHDPKDEVHVLFVEGVPAGFVELDRRVEDEIEITQFGLVREFLGKGLGKYFLHWAIDRAWSYHPKRLWLHTCTDDHPAAIPNYVKAGFAVYKEESRSQG